MQNTLNTLFQQWAWDILYPLDGQNQFIGNDGFERSEIARLIGADSWFNEENPYDPAAARRRLKAAYEAWQQQHDFEHIWQTSLPDTLRHNLAQWQAMSHFNETETRLLTFGILLHSQSTLSRLCNLLGDLDDNACCEALAQLLRQPENQITAALSPKAPLANIGLMRLDRNDEYYMKSKIDLLSRRFADLMLNAPTTPTEILKRHILPAPQTQLTLGDFAHLGVLATAAEAYLRQVFAQKLSGCNILIHGVAGTGKTEFSRVLASALGVELYEISWTNEDDSPADRDDRMNALRMAQNILAGQNSMLMFDEVEDLFDRGQHDFSLNKAWLNRFLENNRVPTIWIGNNVELIDPSAVRRFDIVIEMKAPPVARRAEIIASYTQDFMSKAQIRSLAEHEALVPAVLKQAHKVTQAAGQDWQPEKRSELFQKLLHNTLKAQGNYHALNKTAKLPEVYSLDYLNTPRDLRQLAQGIIAAGRGTLCLYGAAGTGKSAYAAWLAEQAGKQLIYKRSSDLLSKYVGETEQLIAQAFAQAEENQAVLVFDEVDSFLQDRRGANQSWEITQVNEMLTQMEAYQGIFIATTNLMRNLDQAALRRFDFKLEFSPLRPEQAWKLFQAHCAQLNLPCPDELRSEVARIRQLVAGDFAVAAKQARITPFADAQALLASLQLECSLKEGGKGAMGFV